MSQLPSVFTGTWLALDIIDIISAQISLLGRQGVTKPPPGDKSAFTFQTMSQIERSDIRDVGGNEGHAGSTL